MTIARKAGNGCFLLFDFPLRELDLFVRDGGDTYRLARLLGMVVSLRTGGSATGLSATDAWAHGRCR